MEDSYKSEAERRHRADDWMSGDSALPVWLTLGPCGYQAVGLMRSLLAPGAGGLLLDVGGGRGAVLSYLTRGSGAVGLLCDVAYEPLKDYEGMCVSADVLALPFIDGAFPQLVTSDLLEHLHPQDLPRAFAELSRVTGISGRVVVHTSCYGWYLRRLQALLFGGGKGRLDRYDLADGHRNRLKIGELAVLARRSGLVLERAVYYKHLFQPLARFLKELVLGRGKGEEEDRAIEGVKKAKGFMGIVVRIMAFTQSLFSVLDILLFGKIPGGAVVARFRRVD